MALLDPAGHRTERLRGAEDDLDTQPAENLAPIVRNDFLAQVDGGAEAIAAILDPVSAALTTEVLTELGVRVAVDQEDIEDVAAEFLAGSRQEIAAASRVPANLASPTQLTALGRTPGRSTFP